jgi:hypothetical protein
MTLNATVGQILLNDALPADLHDYSSSLDKKGVTELYQKLAEKHSDKFAVVAKRLQDLSRQAAYRAGGFSFDISHLKTTKVAQQTRERLSQKVRQILGGSGSDAQKQDAIRDAVDIERSGLAQKVYDEARASGNPLAMQVATGARGNPTQLSSLIGLDLAYEDASGNRVPFPILKNFSEGLSPAEYFASAFGARKGVVDTKLGTARGGYIAKQMAQLAHRLLVTQLDDDKDPAVLSGGVRGLPVDTADEDNVGALLSRTVGPYPRNTILTPRTLSDLQSRGFKRILVRSPAVGGPGDGVFARDVGVRERGRLPPLGDMVGITASQALSEKLTQGMLSSKHCLMRGSLVRMADGAAKPIEQIEPGDWVLGTNAYRVTFPVRVVSRFDNGRRLCYRTVFCPAFSGEPVAFNSTLDHKLLAGRQVWGQKEELLNHVPRMLAVGTKSRTFYAYLPIGTENRPQWRAEPLAKLAGLLTGDGCYTKSVHGVHLSCFDPTLVAAMVECLAELNLRLTKLVGQKGYYRVSQIAQAKSKRNAAGQFVEEIRNPAAQWLAARGMLGKYAHEKDLPPDIDDWTNESILDYLAGLFSADGSWYFEGKRNNGAMYFSLGMTARPIVEGVKRLLAERFGVYVGTIDANDSAGKAGKRKHTMYQFAVAQAGQVRHLTELLIDRLVGIKQQTAAAALQFVAKYHSEHRLIRRSQKAIGWQLTYDIEVEHPDHLFVLANGLIVSNSAGVKGTAPVTAGFRYVDAMLQAPESLKGAAAHAQLDGRVEKISPAPAGGAYVLIDGEQHYVPGEQTVGVKVGDNVEAGDVLSNGIPHPAEVVKHKGIGEGRRYFINKFREVLNNSGAGGHRRNIELIARGLIDHIEMQEEANHYLPGDVMSYQQLERTWEPREGYQTLEPKQAIGQYLERPVLHYTIGTKIRKHMLPELAEFGVSKIDAHTEPPPFKPVMVRAMENLSQSQDWMVKLLGSHQKRNILDAVHRGQSTDEKGTSFVPSLARGVDFGKTWPGSAIKKT